MNCTLLATLIASIAASPGGWRLQPKFGVGQELTYEGKIREVRASADVESESESRLTVRALVMEKSSDGAVRLGCSTVRKPSDPKVSKPNQLDDALSISFDEVIVEPTGAARWSPSLGGGRNSIDAARNSDIQAHIDTSPAAEMASTRELGFLVEFPANPLKTGEKWVIRQEGAPPLACQVVGPETVMGATCVLVTLHQESQNWKNPSPASPAWCMDAKVWVEEKSRSVFKVDRTTQVRYPGAPGERVTRQVNYEQATNVRYHGELHQRQVEDFRTVHDAFRKLESARSLAGKSERDKRLAQVRRDLKLAMQQLYSTPFRPAIERLDGLAESLLNAEDAPEEPVIVLAGRREAAVGERAPHFVVRDVKTGETISRKTTRGRPVLLVYIDPKSRLSRQTLQAAVAAARGCDLSLYAVCTSYDEATEAALREEVPGEYAVCMGGGGDSAYGIQGTPHVVLIDGEGILRVNQLGYGPALETSLVEGCAAIKTAAVVKEKEKARTFLR